MTEQLWTDRRISGSISSINDALSPFSEAQDALCEMRDDYESALAVKTEHIAALEGAIQELRKDIAGLAALHAVHFGTPEKEQVTVTTTTPGDAVWVTPTGNTMEDEKE